MRLELVAIMLSVLAPAPPSAPPAPRVCQRLFIPATTPRSLATLYAIRSIRPEAAPAPRVVR
jgi:hypothetical protein